MKSLEKVNDGLKQTAARPPGMAAIERAAQRATEKSNQQFAAAHVPVRATVTRMGAGFRIMLKQTGRITRPFAGKTPKQVVRDNIAVELQTARADIAQELRGSLRG